MIYDFCFLFLARFLGSLALKAWLANFVILVLGDGAEILWVRSPCEILAFCITLLIYSGQTFKPFILLQFLRAIRTQDLSRIKPLHSDEHFVTCKGHLPRGNSCNSPSPEVRWQFHFTFCANGTSALMRDRITVIYADILHFKDMLITRHAPHCCYCIGGRAVGCLLLTRITEVG